MQLAGSPVPEAVKHRPALLLTRLGALLAEIADERLAEVNLAGRDYGILAILSDDGPESQLELARMLGKAPPLVVTAIDRLEAAGLVERTRDPDDRRRTRVTVTRNGMKTLARADAIAERTISNLFAGLDESELGEFLRLLEKGAG
jgi:DNA-binding MarR family transcriptional regulator